MFHCVEVFTFLTGFFPGVVDPDLDPGVLVTLPSLGGGLGGGESSICLPLFEYRSKTWWQISEERNKEVNVLFNIALNTFYLGLYGC